MAAAATYLSFAFGFPSRITGIACAQCCRRFRSPQGRSSFRIRFRFAFAIGLGQIILLIIGTGTGARGGGGACQNAKNHSKSHAKQTKQTEATPAQNNKLQSQPNLKHPPKTLGTPSRAHTGQRPHECQVTYPSFVSSSEVFSALSSSDLRPFAGPSPAPMSAPPALRFSFCNKLFN